MSSVLKAIKTAYSDSGQDTESRLQLFTNQMVNFKNSAELFRYSSDNLPTLKHKKEVFELFLKGFAKIDGARLNSK
jgi:hypothetical protein